MKSKASPKVYIAGQKACDCCGDLIQRFVGTWSGHTFLCCDKPACEEVARKRPNARYVEKETLRCTARLCDDHIPEGSYGKGTKFFVCSVKCWKNRAYEHAGGMVSFTCDWCGKVTSGPRRDGNGERRFCSTDHSGRFRHEKTLAKSGIYRSVFDLYRTTSVLDRYQGSSVSTHEHAVATFLGFLNEVGINSLDDVSPLTISEYAKWGRDTGIRDLLYEISHVKMLFDWLLATGTRQIPNPVVSSMHRRRKSKRRARPYSQAQLDLMWSLLDRRGNSRLRAQAAIAEESGMRREEIANIRLDDVDLFRHEILVRLPNKTSRERTSRFGDKAKAMISAWLRVRNPSCGHDHLFHNSHDNPCNGMQMHHEFSTTLCKSWVGKKLHDEGLDSWSIHRLRHTMASRLAAGGADASTIMRAGGWTTYTAMEGYTAVDPEDARRGYEEAMRRSAESEKRVPQTVTLTLEEYLKRAGSAP